MPIRPDAAKLKRIVKRIFPPVRVAVNSAANAPIIITSPKVKDTKPTTPTMMV